MKKLLFFAMAAAGMLTACSNNDNLDATTNNVLSELSQEKIQLGVSTYASATTRGTGTVGGINEEDNVWAGQDIWVYMLKKDSMRVAQYVDPEGHGSDIFNNLRFIAPKAENSEDATNTGVATTANGVVGYYPVDGASDFWGYRVDDAVTLDGESQPAVYMLDSLGNRTIDEGKARKRVVDVTINGTQDIMAGKATLSDEEVQKMVNRPNDFYSAYSARKGVQPNIGFEHLLTRFVFKVKAGNKATAGNGDNTEAVRVTGISVGSKTKGQLTVAYTGVKPDTLLKFVAQDSTALKLNERVSDDHNAKLKEINPTNNNTVALEWDDDADKAKELSIGEALLVAPGELTYPLTIDLGQKVVTAGAPEDTVSTDMSLRQKTTLKLKDGMRFEAGKSYEVTITIYGLEKIQVTATLAPWKDGGKIDIDDDKDPNTSYTEPTTTPTTPDEQEPTTPGEGE